MTSNDTTASKTTRSLLVIEEEYDLRVLLLQALAAERWNVLFALTEEAVADSIKNVAGVVLNWDVPACIRRDKLLKTIGELPLIVTSASDDCTFPGFIKKPYAMSELVRRAQEKISQDRFFVGDRVTSKITHDWGEGRVVSIYKDDFYGVVFKTSQSRNSSEIALRCHFTGLKLIK